jgi:zinc protease
MMRWCPTILIGLVLLGVGSYTTAAAPTIQRWQATGGATVVFVETEALPIVDVRLTFDAGSARDGDQPGLARLTNSLILEGTSQRSAGEIARAFEQRGARVSTGSDRDTAHVSLRSLTRNGVLNDVMADLTDVLANPAFPEDAVERVKRQMQVGLRQDQQSPQALANKAFARALYRDHPYASPPSGTMESVKGLNREAVQDFHRRYYTRANLTLAIVGDVSRERAEAMAERVTEALPEGEKASELPPVPPLESAKTVRVPFDGEQTLIMMGQPGVSRHHEDYLPLYVANHVLGGGGLVSLLTDRMRNQRGLSYSTFSSMAPMARGGRFVVGSKVRNEALDEALSVLRGTLTEFHKDGPGEDRVAAAKSNIIGSFPLSIDSNNDLIGYIGMIGFHGLSTDYLQRLPDRVSEVGRDDAAQAFREHIAPERFVTVLVGPEDVIGAD